MLFKSNKINTIIISAYAIDVLANVYVDNLAK